MGTIVHVDFKAGQVNATATAARTSNREQGAKYEETQDLDIAGVAKLVRADIKAAKKDGNLPAAMKVSVKISRYSMGQSLTVEVVEAPFQVLNPARIVWAAVYPYGPPPVGCYRLTAEATRVLATLDDIVAAYNRRISDHWKFYGHVVFSSEITRAECKAAGF